MVRAGAELPRGGGRAIRWALVLALTVGATASCVDGRPNGAACIKSRDCESESCRAGVCAPPTTNRPPPESTTMTTTTSAGGAVGGQGGTAGAGGVGGSGGVAGQGGVAGRGGAGGL